ncbi:aldehyde dehydrogenase [Pholiota conissans]|uniref:Aldehyde dehydrogenase n=1 Tax=Pholiota conissans TaxID=109636 RepID=A0A9P5Z2T0_9AGAR|nr:aldehyde dehydrogenase [Pholiota conissans]
MTNNYTPIDKIPVIHASLRATFRSGLTKPLAWRRHQLLQLARFIKDNQDHLAAAIHADLGKPLQEIVMIEIALSFERTLICAREIEEWCKDENITNQVQDWQKGWNPRIVRQAKGVVLIIVPWNYPMILSLQPLYGAITAGCCALLKLSEFAPHYASFLADNLPKYLDNDAFRIALGGVPEITKILEYKWDHIFYTGNGRVARRIAVAAAKHLTPLTLELGGKSPVIVDATADIYLAAKRILAGKTPNCGQICVSPDYVLVERAVAAKFVDVCVEVLKEFYPDGALNSSSYGRIVTKEHCERLKDLLERTKGRIVAGGRMKLEEKAIEPTVIADVGLEDSLMEGEIFGPFLPVVAVDSVDDAIDYINDREHALVVYLFTADENTKTKVLENTTSGHICINDTCTQLSIHQMPFGGIGESGYGRQGLRYSYENFVYERVVCEIPYAEELFLAHRYPPYTAESVTFFMQAMKMSVPDSENPAAARNKASCSALG